MDLTDRRPGLRQIPRGQNQGAVLLLRHQHVVCCFGNSLVAERVQKPENIEGRFGQVIDGDQPKASKEGRPDDALLFEDIGECPIRHHGYFAVALTDGRLRKPGAHVNRIGDLPLAHVGGVELAPDQRDIRPRRSRNLRVHLIDR